MPRLRTLVALLAASLILVSYPSASTDEAAAQAGQRQPPAVSFPPAPWALAHRGASGVLPEHTVGAYQLAVDAGADFIECDVVLTSDCALVCRHDAALDATTDAATVFPQHARTYTIDGHPSTGVHAADLTLAQLRTLRARQRRANRPHGADGVWPVAELSDLLNIARAARVGVHVEAKHPAWHAARLPHCVASPADMVLKVAAALAAGGYGGDGAAAGSRAWRAAPVFLQCFEPDALAAAHAVANATLPPLVQLVDRPGVPVPGSANGATFGDVLARLPAVARYAAALGPAIDDVLAATSTLAADARAAGLPLHAYTLRDDAVRPPFADARAEADAVLAVPQVEAVFGDYPVTLVAAVRAARGGRVASV